MYAFVTPNNSVCVITLSYYSHLEAYVKLVHQFGKSLRAIRSWAVNNNLQSLHTNVRIVVGSCQPCFWIKLNLKINSYINIQFNLFSLLKRHEIIL